MIIVYGAAGSGKSETAEKIITSLAKKNGGELIYLATMENKSDAAKARIKRHLKLREGKGFDTIEETCDLSKYLDAVKDKFVLVEDLSNLLANIYFSNKNNDINNQIIAIANSAKEVVIVANNIFEEGPSLDEMCDGYLKALAALNAKLVLLSDTFVEVISGREIIRKGENTWQY